MKDDLEHLLPESFPAPRTFIKSYCGELLGEGLYRKVYVFKPNPKYVVKIMRDPMDGSFANIIESRYWIDAQYTPWQTYLAPCPYIDKYGQIMIQRRVIHKTIDKYPAKMPSIFTDFKITNYGWIGNRIVCCDYGYLLLGVRYQMVKVKWWDVDDVDSKEFDKIDKLEKRK